MRADILKHREAALVSVVEALSVTDQKRLAEILEKMLRKLPKTEIDAYSICRLCDDVACQNCPLDEATVPA